MSTSAATAQASHSESTGTRWQVILAVVFFAQLMTGVGFSMVFPFLPLYVNDLGSLTGLSVEMAAGLVIGVQGFTMMIASPLWGAVADRYGRKPMMMRAQFGGAILLLLMGLAGNAEQLILLRAIQGFVTGTVPANNALVASKTPRERMGFAMGTLQVALWGGMALGPLLGGFLADRFGFAVPFFITAALLLVGGVVILIGIDEDFHPSVEKGQKRPGMIEQWKHVLKADGVSLVYLMRFLDGAGRVLLIPIAPLFVVSLLPESAVGSSIYAGLLISVASLAATFSGVYLGRLGDRVGHRNILIYCAVASMLLYIPQVFVTNVWQLVILQGMTGIALGGLITAPSALLASRTEPGEEGSVYGLDSSISAGARAIAPMLGGSLALWIGYRGMFAMTGMVYAVIAVTAVMFLSNVERKPVMAAAPAAGD